MPRKDTIPLAVRFWAKVDKNGPLPINRPDLGPCWIFHGSMCKGYGQVREAVANGGRIIYAHRLGYELLAGPIPDGCQIDHLCRTPACVRSTHLEPVPQRVNILRGEAFSAQQARRTHCPQGHPYDASNTALRKGHRSCKECNRQRVREAKRLKSTGPRPVQTHCLRGHEFTPENTYLANGSRACRACRRFYFHRRQARLKEAAQGG